MIDLGVIDANLGVSSYFKRCIGCLSTLGKILFIIIIKFVGGGAQLKEQGLRLSLIHP